MLIGWQQKIHKFICRIAFLSSRERERSSANPRAVHGGCLGLALALALGYGRLQCKKSTVTIRDNQTSIIDKKSKKECSSFSSNTVDPKSSDLIS